MKPFIDQYLLDQLPIGGPIQDFNFAKSWTENQGMFYASFTMKDNRKECAGLKQIELTIFKYTLN